MHPYEWTNEELSDTMRSMTLAYSNINKVFLDPSIGYRKAKKNNYTFSTSWSCNTSQNVLVCTPPLETLPSSFGLSHVKRLWSLKTLGQLLSKELGDSWREESILHLSSGGISQSYNIMMALKPRWLIFDILDDNLGFPGITNAERVILERQFLQIIDQATLTTAVSKYLVEKIQKDYSRSVELLSNGVDIKRFAHKPSFNRPLNDLIELEKPIIGFVGAITNWIDIDLIINIARSLDKGTLVFVGPVIENAIGEQKINSLRNNPKIKLLGPKSYDLVPNYLHNFDVLLLPRNYEPHSLASDPLKLYEYMATGKPIVATAIPSAIRFNDFIFVGHTHNDIISLLRNVEYKWSESIKNKQLTEVRKMSWENRAVTLLDEFQAKQLASSRHVRAVG